MAPPRSENRTLLAVIILVLACFTLGVVFYGSSLRQRAKEANREGKELERELERELVRDEERVAEEEANRKERSARTLALTYRLKKVSGRRAQEAASGADPEVLEALDREIEELQRKLRELRESPRSGKRHPETSGS